MILRKALAAFLFVLSLAVGFWLGSYSWQVDHALPTIWRDLCGYVSQHIYLPQQQIQKWSSECASQAATPGLELWSRPQFVSNMNQKFQELGVSHLSLIMPVVSMKYSENVAVDTGIRARRVDGEWFVVRVEPGSVAAEKEIQVGDHIRGINGFEIRFVSEIETHSGTFHLERNDRRFDVELTARVLQLDVTPVYRQLNEQTGYARIPTFLAASFEAERWRTFWQKANPVPHIVLDLRDNYGGNFVAMLRGLSPLFCEPTDVGQIVKPKSAKSSQAEFQDSLDDETQVDIFDRFDVVRLRTFAGYGCYRGRVTVLINENTASVAEIFAQAIKMRPNTTVAGTPSAGSVVLAVWYPVPRLGQGYSLSLPEAEFLDPKGERLEGIGVQPDHRLSYRIEDAREGRDTWIQESVSN